MPILERVHLRRAPRFATALHHVRNLIVNFEKRERPARFAAAAQFFSCRSERRKICPSAAAVLEQHRFAGRQAHDVLHRVTHVLDEAGAALRVLILRSCAFRFARLAIVKIIPRPRAFADAVLMIQSNVEPNWRIEGAVLVQAQPAQLIIKSFGSFRICEITIPNSAVGNGARDAMN